NVDSLSTQHFRNQTEPHSHTSVVSNVWLVIAIAHATIAALIEPIQRRHAPVTAGVCALAGSGAAEPAAANSEHTLQWAFLASQRASPYQVDDLARMRCPAVPAMTAAIGDHVHARSELSALEISCVTRNFALRGRALIFQVGANGHRIAVAR